MVWVGGSQGTLAPCLVDLFLEADKRWPNRSRASDGSLGDAAHASRDSDHNPKSPNPPGWVDAGDLTDDKASGCDADLLAHHLVASRDPRVKYVIWNGTIVRSYDKPGLPAWTPEPYTGSNPHDKHTHISVTPEGRSIRAPWFPQEDDMYDQAARDELISRIDEMRATLGDLTAIKNYVVSIQQTVSGDQVDEGEVARQVLAGLDPKAIAAAVPDELAERVVDLLGERLARPQN